MSLLTRTVLMILLVALSISLAAGMTMLDNRPTSPVDQFVLARNTRRALAYETAAYQGGQVGLSTKSERFADGVQVDPESHKGAKIALGGGRTGYILHRTAIEEANFNRQIGEAKTGSDTLNTELAESGRQIAERTQTLPSVANSVGELGRQARVHLDGLDGFLKRVFNLDFEVHLKTVELNSLQLAAAQYTADAARLRGSLAALQDASYEASREFERAAVLIGMYENRNPRLRSEAARVGSPWLRGQAVWSSDDIRLGLVRINLGSQDGVEVGNVFSVHRDGHFVGRIRVESVERDSAMGRLEDQFRGVAKVSVGDRIRGVANFGATMRSDG